MKIEKRNNFNNDIIIIDGLWGTGKSILAPLVSCMYNIEKVKADSIYEYVSWLNYLGKIDDDAAIWLMRTYADMTQYHNMIGREINLRWSDDTGLKNILNKWSYVKRLFRKEGQIIVDEINSQNIALAIMSHMLMLTPQLLNKTFGSRIKIIETVRHPLYMITHFANYLKRFDSPREFTISYYNNETKIPWFIEKNENQFKISNFIEKAIICIINLYPTIENNINTAKANGIDILVLSFEDVVFDTEITLNKINLFLKRESPKSINKILRKQKIPRKSISQGIGHSSYGFKSEKISEKDYYNNLISLVKENVNSDLYQKLLELIRWYNINYPSKLSNLYFE